MQDCFVHAEAEVHGGTILDIKACFHERFFSAKCELFRLFLLNCDYSNKLFLLDCSQFKRNRRNISHFTEKKRPWNQAFMGNGIELHVFCFTRFPLV
jgi:hypothetical protein